ncbi:uncharacterized protein LOC123308425 [Coccinella septempunctata]|uniref:uncharacterized protein LOC123308425 n=1 Tax=Coccinella septempunctata TaxID=41139 RepID=UPI001D08CFB5|nr:uncharacterized protein LOC123308425 [Coccinella septempunctata]
MFCPNDPGYYTNFIGNVEYHMDEPWYNVRDLLRVLKRIKKLDLAHPENRYKALCWLNGMDCTVPYGPTCRFPYKDFYITEALGCWGQALAQLKKMLAANCMIIFEAGRASPPPCEKKYNISCPKKAPDCGGNTRCCSEVEDVCSPESEDCCETDEPDCCSPQCNPPDNNCPISSEVCDKCLGPDPPSCCPDWCGECKVKKIPPAAYKRYLKGFQDIIEKMIKGVAKKDCVFSRKSFESHYKLLWKRCKVRCDILEDSDSDSDDYICDECCRKEQEEKQCYSCQSDDNYYEYQSKQTFYRNRK